MRIGELERMKERFKNPGKRFDGGRRKTMPFMKKTPSSPKSPLRTRRSSWSGEWLKNATPLRQVIYAMQIQSKDSNSKSKTEIDRTLLLPYQILGNILSRLPGSQRDAISTVCRRWLSLRDRLLQSLNLLDWKFLESGRLISRFSNLTYVNLVNASFTRIPYSGVLIRQEMFSFPIDSLFNPNWLFVEENLLSVEIVDRGIRALASGCPNLRKVALINASELGLLSLAESCPMLQELELHRCNDHLLRGIAAFENLQILRLIGNLDGFYSSSVSDIGLTILAQGCKRLVKLELSGCKGSFDAIKAIGQCCEMIEELSICDHQMDAGWVAALSYFDNLKTLKLKSCRKIDTWSGAGKFLGSCPALERLHLNRSLLSDKDSVLALFRVCEGAREVVFQDCWGLDDATFRLASVFRRVMSLTLEGCSLLTATGLESAILPWEELETLKVVSCKNIKDDEISAALSSLFSLLKELKWMPNRKSQLLSILKGFGVGKRGRKFFKR